MAVVRLTVLPDVLLLGITYMEKTMKKLITITAVVLGLMSPAVADQIVLKDWQLGLDKKQIKQVKNENKLCGKGKFSFVNTGRKKCGILIKGLLTGQMTIANEYVSMPKVEYEDGKSSKIIWIFAHYTNREDTVMPRFNWPVFKSAFVKKYGSAIKCEEHITRTVIGAEYQDETCTITKGDQVLLIDKYGSNIDYGTVVLLNIDQVSKEVNQDQKLANQDL